MGAIEQPDLFGANARALAKAGAASGIGEADAHADAVANGWTTAADAAVIDFLQSVSVGTAFQACEVRIRAEAKGMPLPPDRRAWGGAMRRAKHAGLIEAVGTAMSKDPKQCAVSPRVRPRSSW